MNGRSGPTRTDLEAAARLAPETVHSYLAATGWRPFQGIERPALWTTVEAEQEFEVLLPTDRRLRDFPLRMFDLLQTLAAVEERTVDSVIADLAATNLDTMTFRLLPEGPPGTVPLFNGVDALQGVRELVLASTYAVMVGRPLLVQGRRPVEARRFAERVRLGTPREGSWVITAQLDLPATASATQVPDPFPRKVSLQAHRAVGAALRAAGEALRGEPVEPFLRRAEEGVSANICEALARLGRDESSFEIRFGWVSQHSAPVGTRRFRFDRPVIAALRVAAEHLRGSLPDGRVEVTGTVTKLSRAAGDFGDVVITGVARTEYGEAEQKVKVHLAADMYDLAVQAHRLQRTVQLLGLAFRGKVETVFQMEVEQEEDGPAAGS